MPARPRAATWARWWVFEVMEHALEVCEDQVTAAQGVSEPAGRSIKPPRQEEVASKPDRRGAGLVTLPRGRLIATLWPEPI